MKAGHKMQSLTLLSHVVRRQPSWLRKIVQAPLFISLLNCLKMDTDIPVIMCGLLSVTTLLPMIPSLVGPSLPEIFRVFSHLASWNVTKPGGIPDVYQLHLQVAVYALFHRLYGMYPLSFLQYLRSYYQNRNEEFKKAVLVSETGLADLECSTRLHYCAAVREQSYMSENMHLCFGHYPMKYSGSPTERSKCMRWNTYPIQ